MVSQISSEPQSDRRSGVQVISRAAAILRVLVREPIGLSLSEVVARADLAKSTTYRILLALEQEELVESVDGRYRIGRSFVQGAVPDTEHVKSRIRPFLARLSSEIQETIDLAVLVGDQMMIVEQMRWVRELTAASVVGAVTPAWPTANGRALLACTLVPDDPGQLPVASPEGIDQEMMAELIRIRRDKIAVVEDSVAKGVSGIATFGFADDGRPWSLGIPVPTVRFTERLDEIRNALLDVRPEFQRLISRG